MSSVGQNRILLFLVIVYHTDIKLMGLRVKPERVLPFVPFGDTNWGYKQSTRSVNAEKPEKAVLLSPVCSILC